MDGWMDGMIVVEDRWMDDMIVVKDRCGRRRY